MPTLIFKLGILWAIFSVIFALVLPIPFSVTTWGALVAACLVAQNTQ
jgi:hypothetical protein